MCSFLSWLAFLLFGVLLSALCSLAIQVCAYTTSRCAPRIALLPSSNPCPCHSYVQTMLCVATCIILVARKMQISRNLLHNSA